MEAIKKYLQNTFTLDLRALAVFRIALALLMIGDLSVRVSDVQAFYSDEGWMPLHFLMQSAYWSKYHFSIHAMSGAIWFQYLLFGIAYVFALSMLVGKHTRLSTFMCWIFLVSIHNRNVLVMQGGDDFMRLTFFWAMFLPLGKMWSVDSAKKPVERYTYFSMANIGYILLLFSVYFFSALLKHSPEWYQDGTALYYAFSLEQLTYPLAKLLYPYEDLLRVATFVTIYLELIAPFFLLVPWKNDRFRMAYFTLFLALHIGIGMTLQVGYFFIISIIAMIGILPARFMDWLGEKLQRFSIPHFWNLIDGQSFSGSLIKLEGSIPRLKVNRQVINGLVIFAIVFSLVWNIGNMVKVPEAVAKVVHPIGTTTRLSQNWGMFAPTVFKADGWYVYKAKLQSGKTIDILNRKDTVDYEKPDWPVFQYKNAKWRKIGENLILDQNESVRWPFCQFILNKYNSSHANNKIDTLQIIYMREISQPEYFVPEPEKGILCTCAVQNK